MSASKFKFVSPGIFLKEIDNSHLPAAEGDIGPMVVGLFERGPGMVPQKIESLSELIDTFGNPIPGGKSGDLWRDGNYTAPTYAAYAAQAWLSNNSSVNVLRVLGTQNSSATTAGQAGFQTTNDVAATLAGGGAYGLWIVDSGSVVQNVTGALAAVWYLDTGALTLEGNARNVLSGSVIASTDTTVFTGHSTGSTAQLLEAVTSTGAEFTVEIQNASDAVVERATFNFDPQSEKYIRKVFNTNPTLTNSSVTETAQLKTYWLGETYERHLNDKIATGAKCYGVILALGSGSADWSNRRFGAQAAQTGWTVSQDLGDRTTFVADGKDKLFKIHSRYSGEWDQKNLKITIEDIKKSGNAADPYGTFTVAIRKIGDLDSRPQFVETFTNCNLNPNSPSYIGFKIGDKYSTYSETQRRMIEYGQYANKSKFIRVEVSKALEDGTIDAELLPWGFFGPPKPIDFTYMGGNQAGHAAGAATVGSPTGKFVLPFRPHAGGDATRTVGYLGTGAGATTLSISALDQFTNVYVKSGKNIAQSAIILDDGIGGLTGSSYPISTSQSSGTISAFNFTGTFYWPSMALKANNANEGLTLDQVRFGVDMRRSSTSKLFDKSMLDISRALPEGLQTSQFSADLSSVASLEHSFMFTLDDISGSLNSLDATYVSGSRLSGESLSAGGVGSNGYTNYNATLEYGVNGFTMPFFGGSDGHDITEKNPLRNGLIGDGATETTNHVFNTLKQSIDTIRDPEDSEYNIVAIPGTTKPVITNMLMDMVEDRGDALAIIDIENDYTPSSDTTDAFSSRVGNADSAERTLRARELDTSYSCCYYPWVQILDREKGIPVWVPPSVVALGAMSFGQSREKLWFAPAGFNRGGLSTGAAGLPVIGITQKLSSKQRDKLYAANINPIASFPSEGIVIFGQKTLQASPSALDRVNVRRLMIFLKKRISRIAATVLFDQNVAVTWNRFTGQVEPFLRSVKAGLGLTDYRIVLDNTTTTPDLIDRNILYAKIFLKPAKAIEFIAIDFNISREGAAFAD
jgi:hypothetical protein